MSKAEERALEKYPLMSNDDKEGLEALKYIEMECECASAFNEVQEAKRTYFIEGYHQAEKDNELTWEDIKEIYLLCNFIKKITCGATDKDFKEVLKRFNKQKKDGKIQN